MGEGHQVLRQPAGRAHQLVVEELLVVARGRLPPDLLDLPRLRDPVPLVVLLLVGLRLVVVVTRQRGPMGVRLCVEGPEREVGAVDLRQFAGLLQGVWPEPEPAEPETDLFAGIRAEVGTRR